ncbi:MAG: hypothetical protein AAGA81_11355 [Acidobacteriota bacterium]
MPNPVLFVTQVPVPNDFATIGSVFANHRGSVQSAPRGGGLYLLSPSGELRNLTQEAGYGDSGSQGASAIAVREPEVHWSGTKAVFSMLVGAPAQRYQVASYFWQLFEVTGFGTGETAVVTKLPHQDSSYNNVSPTYLSDGRILFVSDRPRRGEAHLYPLLDEYESTPTPTGLWALDPESGTLDLFNHTPSGALSPFVDSYGRVVVTRWDHLQRDQQADADAAYGSSTHGSFDYADESAGAARRSRAEELFPEPRRARQDLLQGTPLEGHSFNHFLPWQIRQDGTEEEMLNHVGRHELVSYFNRVRGDDPNLREFIASISGRANEESILNLLQMREDPTQPGRYVGTDAPEFQTHASGRLVSFEAPAGGNPDALQVTSLTHPDTFGVTPEGSSPSADHSGHYRDALPLSDGQLLAVHADETRRAQNTGTRAAPQARYDFRLRLLQSAGNGYLEAGASLTGGIEADVSYWDPDVRVRYEGPLWELDPVEVRARPAPNESPAFVAQPERDVFDEEGVDPVRFADWLKDHDLGLLVVRDATARDGADRQQPFNLQVPGGRGTVGAEGTVYDITHLQLYQGDRVRGYGGRSNPGPGRRVLARRLNHAEAVSSNPTAAGGPPASVEIHPDGSVAAFVPGERALAWQTTAPDGTPVVRERVWVTVQPGEIRTCDGCHGVNTASQSGADLSTQKPEALRTLLRHWLTTRQDFFRDSFESGDSGRWSASLP